MLSRWRLQWWLWCGDWARADSEEEGEESQDNLHHGPGGAAGELLPEDSVSRCVHQGGGGAEVRIIIGRQAPLKYYHLEPSSLRLVFKCGSATEERGWGRRSVPAQEAPASPALVVMVPAPQTCPATGPACPATPTSTMDTLRLETRWRVPGITTLPAGAEWLHLLELRWRVQLLLLAGLILTTRKS